MFLQGLSSTYACGFIAGESRRDANKRHESGKKTYESGKRRESKKNNTHVCGSEHIAKNYVCGMKRQCETKRQRETMYRHIKKLQTFGLVKCSDLLDCSCMYFFCEGSESSQLGYSAKHGHVVRGGTADFQRGQCAVRAAGYDSGPACVTVRTAALLGATPQAWASDPGFFVPSHPSGQGDVAEGEVPAAAAATTPPFSSTTPPTGLFQPVVLGDNSAHQAVAYSMGVDVNNTAAVDQWMAQPVTTRADVLNTVRHHIILQ